jgi:hypothetical protein
MIALAMSLVLTCVQPRPPSSYTTHLKHQQLWPWQDPRDYVEDHIMPLCLCGAARDPRNLRPQLKARAKLKDVREHQVCAAVKSGQLTLPEGQQIMHQEWP